jgi:hypothetical protein
VSRVDLERLQELAAVASEDAPHWMAEWVEGDQAEGYGDWFVSRADAEEPVVIGDLGWRQYLAEHIAAADPATVLALIAELRAAREVVAKARDLLAALTAYNEAVRA